MSLRILLVEDEPNVALTISDLLSAEGYDVKHAADGITGLARASDEEFDAIVLDLMLPGKSGFDVCREIRQNGKDVAILMLTAKTQLIDRVVGLKLGADDYLSKPFEPPELLARIEALLRRAKKGLFAPVTRYQFGRIEIDFDSGQVRNNGMSVSLATKELELLRYLIENRGRVVPREELLKSVWNYQPGVSSRTIDTHIGLLRQKLEADPIGKRHIYTIRGVGYRFLP